MSDGNHVPLTYLDTWLTYTNQLTGDPPTIKVRTLDNDHVGLYQFKLIGSVDGFRAETFFNILIEQASYNFFAPSFVKPIINQEMNEGEKLTYKLPEYLDADGD